MAGRAMNCSLQLQARPEPLTALPARVLRPVARQRAPRWHLAASSDRQGGSRAARAQLGSRPGGRGAQHLWAGAGRHRACSARAGSLSEAQLELPQVEAGRPVRFPAKWLTLFASLGVVETGYLLYVRPAAETQQGLLPASVLTQGAAAAAEQASGRPCGLPCLGQLRLCAEQRLLPGVWAAAVPAR